MELFSLNENSIIDLKNILNRLGYIILAKNSLGSRAGQSDIIEKATSRFIRKNQEYLKYIDLKIENQKLFSSSTAGIVPLEFAIDKGEKANLTVEPMINWQILSEFAAVTKNRDWIKLNENWLVSKVLDVELWYFSKPFLEEAISVLNRPAKGFKTDLKVEAVPRGNTNWLNYSINQYPYLKFQFENRFSKSTLDVLPHSLIIWAVDSIINSIQNYQSVPETIKNDLKAIKSILGNSIAPITPTYKIFSQLPQTGAWSGYKNLYKEIEHLAILSGILRKEKLYGCAYSIKTERLFEEFVMFLNEKYASDFGYNFYKDTNDSSRIGFLEIDASSKFKMMNSLRPDIVMTNSEMQIIVDAKYKRHFDLASNYWTKQDENYWEEDMRQDLHQALSYSIFSEKKKNLILLAHPRLTNFSKFHIRRVSRNRNILVGYLPIHFDRNKNIKNAINEYVINLNTIIKNFA